MIVKNVSVEKLLPLTYIEILFEFKDQKTLYWVQHNFSVSFSGKIISWSDVDSKECNVDIEFESESDACLFVLKHL